MTLPSSLANRLPGAVVWTTSLLVLGLTLGAPHLSGFGQNPQSNQQAPKATATGLIMGRLVDADAGTPLAGAIVTVTLPATAASRGNNGIGALNAATIIQIGQTGSFSVVGGGGGGGSTVQMLTDSDGWFVFRDLPPGSYNFRASLSGYTGGGYNQRRVDLPGQPLVLGDGQQIGDVTLRMWKLASISGTVTDENGDPVVGALVRVLRRTIVGGHPVLAMSGFGRSTDDRGQYRAFDIPPGDYVVCVPAIAVTAPVSVDNSPNMLTGPDGQMIMINPGGRAMSGSGQRVGDLVLQTGLPGRGSAVPPPVGDNGKVFVYPTVFYPSATTSSRASVISLKSGEARTGADMQLPLLPTVRVSGTVIAPDGPAASVQVHLVAAEPDQGLVETAPDDVAMSVTDGQGRFTLLGVPRGQYQIKITRQPPVALNAAADGSVSLSRGNAPAQWAAAPVSADQSDVTGLSLVLQPGYTVAGRIVFDGTSPQPNTQQMGRGGVRLVQSQGGGGRAAAAGNVFSTMNPDGTFSGTGYVPGRYSVIPPQWGALKWVAKSMVAGGNDVSDAPLDLTSDVTNLTVTFTDRPAQVTGTVRDASGKADPNAIVAMFPPDPRTWGWPNGLHTKSSPVTAAGTFAFSSLAPGDYMMVAIPDGWENTWRDPAILDKLVSQATRVQLRDGDTRTEDLRTVTIR